jgi:DNA-binding CsgD family transcriptional regulator
MRRGRPPYPDLLTPREQEVLALIREGLTNEQIAGRLGISESGARYHVSEILSKLGVESRTEAAAWSGDVRTPVPASVPLLERVRQLVSGGASRLWAAVGVAIAAVALVALAIGVAVNEARDGDQQAAAPTHTPGPEVRRMQELEVEARKLRDVVAPDAYLFRMQYPSRSKRGELRLLLRHH